MSQNQTTSVSIERAVLQGIHRRLKVAAGKCTISVKSLANRAAREAGLIEDGHPPQWAYVTADRIIVEKGGKFWGHGTWRVPKHKRGKKPLQSRIYIFDVSITDIEKIMDDIVCPICGDSNPVRTPHETFCNTCGNGGAS